MYFSVFNRCLYNNNKFEPVIFSYYKAGCEIKEFRETVRKSKGFAINRN